MGVLLEIYLWIIPQWSLLVRSPQVNFTCKTHKCGSHITFPSKTLKMSQSSPNSSKKSIANDKYLEHVFEKFPRYHIFEVSTLRTIILRTSMIHDIWKFFPKHILKYLSFLEDPNKNQVPIWTLPEWACNFHLGNLPKLIVLYKHGVIGEWNLVSGCYTLTLRTYIRWVCYVLSIGVLSVRLCYVLSVRFFFWKIFWF